MSNNRNKEAERRRTEYRNKQLIAFGLVAVALVGYGIADYYEFHNIFRETPPDGITFGSGFSNKDLDGFAKVANSHQEKYSKCQFELIVNPSKTGINETGESFLGRTIYDGNPRIIEIHSDKTGQGNINVFAHEIFHGCGSDRLEYQSPIRFISPVDNASVLDVKYVEGLKLYIDKYDGNGSLVSSFEEVRIEEFVIETMISRDGYKSSLHNEYIWGKKIFEPYLANIPNSELDFYLRNGKVLDLVNKMFPRNTYEESLQEVFKLLNRVPKSN